MNGARRLPPARRRSLRCVLLLPTLAALAIAILAPVATRAAAPALGDSLRLDPLVQTGVLPNGLTWYVRANHRPEHRVSLRLVLAAGSNEEADDQRGLAHLCEHMNFDGSTHFKPEELVAYFESIGIHFGYDANAYTSYDETVYMLDLPSDRDTLLDRGLTALADFAGGALLTDAQLEKERKVVLEEWRLGRGASDRIWRRQEPVLYHGSRYAEREPIGLPDVIEHAPAARVRDFYRTWYTPDRMAVVAVGDVEPARMDSLIGAHFGPLGRASVPQRPTPPGVPLHADTLVSIATDKEATGSQIGVTFKRPLEPIRTVGQYRLALLESLYGAMLNSRLDEIAHRAQPPFQAANSGASTLGRSLDTWRLWAMVPDSGMVRGLGALLDEVERVRRHGFLASELARAKENLRQGDASRYAEREKQLSTALVGRYVNAFLHGTPTIGTERGHELLGALLDGMTLDEINALTPRLMPAGGVVVLASGPDKPGVHTPSEADLRAVLAPAARGDVSAWQDRVADRALMKPPAKPGRIAARRELKEIGVTELTFGNGVTAWLKPTDFKADEIVLGAEGPGGVSLADSSHVVEAEAAGSLATGCGMGGFTPTELRKLLAGKLVSVTPYIGGYDQGLQGRTRPADLETALQLVTLTLTSPTPDTTEFGIAREHGRTFLANRANDPEQVYGDTLTRVNTGDFWMDRPMTVAQLEAARLDRIVAFYRSRFANATDLTFFFVGSFRVDSIAPLLARYLGALPAAGHATSRWREVGPRRPAGITDVRVRRGIEPKAQATLTFFGDAPFDERSLHAIGSARAILQERLRQTLREKLGGTYGAQVGGESGWPLHGAASTSINFGCEPGRVDSLIAATLAEVRRLQAQGPDPSDVEKQQEIERRELEVGLKENGRWLLELQSRHRMGWDPLGLNARRAVIDALDPAAVQRALRSGLPCDHYSVVTLLPGPGVAGATGK